MPLSENAGRLRVVRGNLHHDGEQIDPLYRSDGKPVARSYADGGGLYLLVHGNRQSWLFRYAIGYRTTAHGQTVANAHNMGLGGFPAVSLADARQLAEAKRLELVAARDGKGPEPLTARRERQATAEAERALQVKTFQVVAEEYVAAKGGKWSSPRTLAKWRYMMTELTYPLIGAKPVAAITHLDVERVLTQSHTGTGKPLWGAIPETAMKLRARIEDVLDYANGKRYRSGDNPAKWKGNLDALLATHNKADITEHHAAMAYTALPAFMSELRRQQNIAARALEFTILTAARTGETLGATWKEVDLKERLWTIPKERMKATREHRVCLSARAMAILAEARSEETADDDYVFSYRGGKKPFNQVTVYMYLLRWLGREKFDFTVHGFRSTFADWATEKTNHDPNAIELALAHRVGDAVVQAYRRGDLLEKRRKLAEDWTNYCTPLALPAPARQLPAPEAVL